MKVCAIVARLLQRVARERRSRSRGADRRPRVGQEAPASSSSTRRSPIWGARRRSSSIRRRRPSSAAPPTRPSWRPAPGDRRAVRRHELDLQAPAARRAAAAAGGGAALIRVGGTTDSPRRASGRFASRTRCSRRAPRSRRDRAGRRRWRCCARATSWRSAAGLSEEEQAGVRSCGAPARSRAARSSRTRAEDARDILGKIRENKGAPRLQRRAGHCSRTCSTRASSIRRWSSGWRCRTPPRSRACCCRARR